MNRYIQATSDGEVTFNLALGYLSEYSYDWEDDSDELIPELDALFEDIFSKFGVIIDDITYNTWDDMYVDELIELQEEYGDDVPDSAFCAVLDGLIDLPEDTDGLSPQGVGIEIKCHGALDDIIINKISDALNRELPKLGYGIEDLEVQ